MVLFIYYYWTAFNSSFYKILADMKINVCYNKSSKQTQIGAIFVDES